MRFIGLLFILALSLKAEQSLTLGQLKKYDANRVRIDRESSTHRGLPLTIQGRQLFTKEDHSPLKKFSEKAWKQRQKGYRQNRSGAALTIGGFVGLETGICLIPVGSEGYDSGPGPTPYVIGSSLPMLITGLVKLNRGFNTTMEAYCQYERDLRKQFHIPGYFTVKVDEETPLNDLQRYQNYLNYTVTITPGEMGRFYNLKLPYEMNGTTVNLSSRSAKHIQGLMPSFTPLAAEEMRKAWRLQMSSTLSMSSGLSLAGVGGFLAFCGLLSEISGGGPSDQFYIVTGIVMPAVGVISFCVSIPLGVRSQKRFNQALKTYDQELRAHYNIH